VLSLIIGAVAGTLAALSLDPTQQIERKTLLFFLAAGYAGTDFIEAFYRGANGSGSPGRENG
jgi:hypothetical protein